MTRTCHAVAQQLPVLPKSLLKCAKIKVPLQLCIRQLIQKLKIFLNIEHGKLLLENYRKTQTLQPAQRTMIVHKIIQYYIEHNIKLNVARAKYLSECIVELFPTESQNTYFVGRGKLPPKGKLWDRYQSQTRNIKKSFGSEERQKEKALDAKRTCRKIKEISDALSLNEQANIALTLKSAKQWDEVLVKWKKTVKYRRYKIDSKKEANLIRILQDWPFYKLPRAPELVHIDFDRLITEKDRFFQKWQHFLNVAPALFKIRIKDAESQKTLTEFLERKTHLTPDTICFQNMHLLHAVLKPPSVYLNSKRKKFSKYSISDSQSSFTQIIKNTEEVEDVLLAMREICPQNETCLQPIIIVVGDHFDVKQFYVALDDIKWEFDAYWSALEFCFKLYYVLNVPYPKECALVWTFVQKYLYGIETEELEVDPILAAFIGENNAFQHAP